MTDEKLEEEIEKENTIHMKWRDHLWRDLWLLEMGLLETSIIIRKIINGTIND